MLGNFLYGIRYIFWWLRNSIRKLRKPPQYVVFSLEGDYLQIPHPGENPILRLLRPKKPSLIELVDQIRMVAEDPGVKGVVFLLRPLEMPFAKIDVLRDTFYELQRAGKTVTTWSYILDTRMYYLASAADKITLMPGGSLAPQGVYRQYTYLAEGFKKAGLKADFIRTTAYKSAADIFTESEMSSEVREMGNWLADATYEEILDAISKGRKIEKGAVVEMLDQTPCTDLNALALGAVDELLSDTDLPKYLGSNNEPAVLVPWESARKRLILRPHKRSGKYIALMRIGGLIIDGHSSSPPIKPPIPVPLVLDERAGDISVVNTIRQIKRDNRAAGVLLYVNSRGGSATASESIRASLASLAEVKPLIVVMGPVAGSGGYWISIPGRRILAQPNTLTGSIGVIFGKIADEGLLDKFFINQESISRGENAGIYSPENPFTEDERELIQEYIRRVYALFLDHVSESREINRDELEKIAGGRVWTGRQAVENELIDGLGGLDQALSQIIEMTGLGDQTPIRIFEPGKKYIPPLSEPASILNYGWNNMKILTKSAMCICPWFES